jgi:hypothetical protein
VDGYRNHHGRQDRNENEDLRGDVLAVDLADAQLVALLDAREPADEPEVVARRAGYVRSRNPGLTFYLSFAVRHCAYLLC